jgi:hypothetical protein
VRVNGRGVEPAAEERNDLALLCRVYRTEHGVGDPWPDEQVQHFRDWIDAGMPA